MREVEVQVEHGGDRFVLRELFAIVGSQRVRVLSEGIEQLENGLCDLIGRAPFDLAQQRQTRFALGESDNGLASALPEDSVHFPIAEPFSLGYDFRSFIDADAIREFPSPVANPCRLDWVAPVAFAPLLLTA